MCAVATQGSALYDTDYVTEYEIQTSLDRENWATYQENGTAKVTSNRYIPLAFVRNFGLAYSRHSVKITVK